MKRIFQLLPLFIIALTVVGFFYKSFLFGLIPAPTDALIGLYHPWRDLYATTNPRGIPFKNFLITDPVRQQIPWRKIAIDQWKAKEIPAWNPYTFLGTPLAANIQAGAYQPINILFSFFSFPITWTFLVILQSFFGALFLFIYLRNLGLSVMSAYFGAIVWAFCGFSIVWLTWGTIGWTAAIIPLLLYKIDKISVLLNDKKVSWITIGISSLLLGASGAVIIVSGHVQIALYGLLVSFVYGVYRFWSIQNKARALSVITISVGVLFLCSYIVWKPFMQYYVLTARSTPINLSNVAGWLLPPTHLLQFIAPDFFGNPSTLNYWGVWNYGELVGYIGIIPLVFAGSALFFGGVTTFWSVVLVVSLGVMIESPLTHMLYGMRIPIFSSLQPTRLMVIVDLSLAILSAVGLETLLTKKFTRLNISYAVIFIVFLIVFFFVLYRGRIVTDLLLMSNFDIAKRNLIIPMILLISFGGVLWVSKVVKKVTVRVMVGIIICISILDLFRFGWKFTPFTPLEYFFPQTKILSFLQSQKKPFRVMSMDDRILPPNTGGYYGIETIEGYDPLYPTDYVSFLYGSNAVKSGMVQRIFTLHDLNNPALRYFNVRYVLTFDEIHNPDYIEVFEEGETKVYLYSKSLPRVYLSTPEDVKNMIAMTNEFASIERYRDNAMSIKTSTNVSRILVILNRYDTGWRASIDGGDTNIFRVNELFQGVVVPEGIHTVKLWYKAL